MILTVRESRGLAMLFNANTYPSLKFSHLRYTRLILTEIPPISDTPQLGLVLHTTLFHVHCLKTCHTLAVESMVHCAGRILR